MSNDPEWCICLRMWKPVKEVVIKIMNKGRMYKTRSVLTRFPRGPDDRYNGVAVYKAGINWQEHQANIGKLWRHWVYNIKLCRL